MKNYRRIIYPILIVIILLFASCATAIKNLTAEEKDFYDKASLIMTNAEKKEFRELTNEGRVDFINRFWERRNPDPTADVNVFKKEFYRRVSEADRLFKEGAGPGYKTDRGRVYVILGAPDRRDAYPTGYSFYAPPVEIWWYGFFQIIFVDYHRENRYQLEPGSAFQLGKINETQMHLNRPLWEDDRGENRFDFDMNSKYDAGSAKLQFLVPAKSITFSQNKENNTHVATLQMEVLIFDDSTKDQVARKRMDFPFSLNPEQISTLPKYIVLEMNIPLEKGRYVLTATLTNLVDQASLKKQFNVNL